LTASPEKQEVPFPALDDIGMTLAYAKFIATCEADGKHKRRWMEDVAIEPPCSPQGNSHEHL
jgi:hypothetical protein